MARNQEAVRIGRAAVETRQAKNDPWLMALLHRRQAVGHARTGERTRAERSLARAETAYDRAQGQPAAWLSFLTPAEITGLAGAAHQALGRHARAQKLTSSALALLEPRFERNRVYYTAQHAQGLLDGGEAEHAVAEAARAAVIAKRVQSDRVQNKLDDLRRQMRQHAKRVPDAADFLERTRDRGPHVRTVGADDRREGPRYRRRPRDSRRAAARQIRGAGHAPRRAGPSARTRPVRGMGVPALR